MKSKIAVLVIIVIAVIGSWGIAIFSHISEREKINNINNEIKKNEELGIYKTNIELYKELIKADKENIDSYVKLADAYMNLKQYGNYEKECNEIITTFPKDITGYFKLAQYYSKDKRHNKVLDVYNKLPKELKSNKQFSEVYKQSEYQYQYESTAYDEVGMYGNHYAIVKVKGMYGYVNEQIGLAIKAKFEKAKPFLEDTAAVYNDGEWYFIDRDGDKVMAAKDKFEDLFSMSEGYAGAKIDGKYGFVDSKLKKVKFGYELVTNFYNGVAAVKNNGKWQLIDKKFEKLTEAIYDDLVIDEADVCSRRGVIFLKKNGVYHMFGINGKELTSDTFDEARMFQSDEATAVKKEGKWGFINKNGKKVLDFKYDDAYAFNLGLAPVFVNNKWGYINSKGEIVILNEFDDARVFYKNGVTSVKIGNSFRFIRLIKYKTV